jgi:hypothetical protein
MNYVALISYGDDDFGKFSIVAHNDKEALEAAKEKAREFDGAVVSVVQGKNYETGRVVS